jgi:acetoacetate decarboxylase
MKLDPTKLYQMPLALGPIMDRSDLPRLHYREVEILAIQYHTEPEAIGALLPDCYQPDEKNPQVTVMFGYNNGLDFMAGGEYRLAAVQVAALFTGEQDQIAGDYNVVMFENKTWPIIGGRELLGVPKLHADISSIKVRPDGSLQAEASLWGHFLFGIEIESPRPQNRLVRLVAKQRINSRPWLGYKYIPSLDGPPDADYPTFTQNDTTIDRLWLGREGRLTIGKAGYEQIVEISGVLDALRNLPVHKVIQALRFRGSAFLRMDLSRRLG